MSTLPAHIWDSQFRMLRVAFACATLHLCTLPADDRKSFCPLPFSLFCMKSLGYGCILQTPKRQLRRFCLSYLLDLNFTCASKQYVRFLMLMFSCFCCFQPPEVSFQPELKNFMNVCISCYSGSPPLHLDRPHLTGTH